MAGRQQVERPAMPKCASAPEDRTQKPQEVFSRVRCLGVIPGTHRVDIVARPEPGLPADHEVLIEMVECGVCGTDRHIIDGDWARPEPGQQALVLGHEPLGRVLQVGAAVGHLAAGDYVTATNQRSCGACAPCAVGEPDLCLTAAGSGRGVGGMDGFLRPRLLDDAAYCVRVPAELRHIAVLTEPLAVSEKVIAQLRQIQRRLPRSRWTEQADSPEWAQGLRCVVGGAGPIGTLAAFALRCHGAEVHVLDRAPLGGFKARTLQQIGAHYHCTAGLDLRRLGETLGPIDVTMECAGSAELFVALWRALGRNGAMALVGGAGGPHDHLHPGDLLGQALGRNQVLVGTVASNPRHFQMALDDLEVCRRRFPQAITALVTGRHDFDHADGAFAPVDAADIKRVITLEGV